MPTQIKRELRKIKQDIADVVLEIGTDSKQKPVSPDELNKLRDKLKRLCDRYYKLNAIHKLNAIEDK